MFQNWKIPEDWLHLLDIGDAFGLFCIVVAGDVDIADIAKNFEVVFYVVWPSWLVKNTLRL